VPGFEVIGAEERAEVEDVFAAGGVLCRDGFAPLRHGRHKVREFEEAFASAMGVPHALAVTSGTAALRVAFAAAGIGPGDEVVTQCFTFVATVEAIVESGATPVCAEIDETLNLDPADLERRITPRTKAVVPVHMLGTPARLPEIEAVCRRHGLLLIEDAAWGCGGALAGRALGAWGDIGTFSFDFAKTMTTGEGGMVVCRDESMHKRAAAWHDHGHENNPALPRWEDTRAGSGFNFRMTELQGAVGLAQLRKLPAVVAAQRATRDRLAAAIRGCPGVELRPAPRGSEETADALVFAVPSREAALACRAALVERGLATKILPEAITWHFAGTWRHITPLAERHGGRLEQAFPGSRARLERAVSVPVLVRMPEGQPERLAEAVTEALVKPAAGVRT